MAARDNLALTKRILKELKREDGTALEVAAELDVSTQKVKEAMSSLQKQGCIGRVSDGKRYTYHFIHWSKIGRPRKGLK